MNTFDLFIFIPIAAGLVFGLFKGFVKELTSFITVFVAWFAAEIFNPVFSPQIIRFFHFSEKTGATFSYILIFLAVIILMLILSKFIEKIISKIHLGWLNSLAGGLLGALKYAIIVSVLMNAFDALDTRFHFAKQEKKEASIGYYPILKMAPSLWKETKEIYEKQKQKNTDKLEDENEKSAEND